jgi:Ca-dependent carbohydrate-binding module xylan-binding
VSVAFLNDAWGGTATTDRNLYVDAVSYKGVNTNQSASLLANGANVFTVTGGTAMPPPAPTPITAGTGPDALVLNISEDAYANGDGISDAKGDATFTVSVDGKQVGGTFTALGSHAAGQKQVVTLNGYFGRGSHDVALSFLNDAWGGTATTDRNLYVNSVTYKGTNTGQSASLLGNGSHDFTVNGGTTRPSITVQAAGKAVVTVDATVVHSETDYGATINLTAPGVASVVLGSTADTMHFIGMSKIALTAGSAASTVVASGGANTITAGKGALNFTGGTGADTYIFHALTTALTVRDFSLAKGDVLTVDQSLRAAFKETSDGHGGSLISFGSTSGNIYLINVATLSASSIHYV